MTISVTRHRGWIRSLKMMREFMTDEQEDESRINDLIRWNFEDAFGKFEDKRDLEEAVMESR